MKDAPTPRTDALRTKLHVNINTPNIVKYMETVLHANTLEMELTTSREEINILKSKYADHHTEAEKITAEIKTVTEQRDKLLEQQEQCRLSSVCRELVEQRDKLAEALENCREDSIELLCERDWWQLENRGDYQQRYQSTRDNVTHADAALQSLIKP